ncbi:MAG: hypothetical protein HN742_19385 [Lentisphaerae bacterium]|jgi:hypothetical protein|nr:hypothetical protein [Lentisphaerota bacterium]MBT4821762.1 hypothetical protein [Lentisphaerota bacterium]MBT5611813.1 hypothetical protein [Lentisphaerota bacterium]MBT7053492.1 hypothetical protein [Lentisphaerota bacterium]MBT7844052.1 hypothetical protein [Lentisphaerota bacterium]
MSRIAEEYETLRSARVLMGLAAVLGMGFLAPVRATENMLAGGLATGDARAWTPVDAEVGHHVDKGVSVKGGASLRVSLAAHQQLRSKHPALRRSPRWAARPVAVEPGRMYSASALARAELDEGRAGFFLGFYDGVDRKAKRITGKQALLVDQSTAGEWVSLRFSFVAPEAATSVRLAVGADDLTGNVWFDAIQLSPGEPQFVIPRTETPPEIDGWIDEDVYQSALTCGPFLVAPGAKDRRPAHEQATAWLLLGPDNLYLAVRSELSNGRAPVAKRTKRDDSVWNDDCIELFLDPEGKRTSYYQFGVSASGALYDTYNRARGWTSHAEAKTRIEAGDFWSMELRIPLTDIGIDKGNEDLEVWNWTLNVTSTHYPRGAGTRNRRLGSWAAVPVQFHDPNCFVAVSAGAVAPTHKVGFLYSAAEAAPVAPPELHWVIDDPLYEELITDEKSPFSDESCFIWRHPLEPKRNRSFAMQYGQRYTREDILAEYERHRLMPYGSTRQMQTDETEFVPRWCRDSGIGMVLYSPCHFAGNIKVPGKGLFQYEEEAMEDYVLKAHEEITDLKEILWAVSMGDEAIEYNARRFIEGVSNPKVSDRYPYFRRAAEEIETTFGYGKYGPPSSRKVKEPYNWLAFRRWLLSKAVESQRNLWELTRDMKVREGRRPVVISENSVGTLKPYHYSRQAPYFDIVTDQFYPGNSRWRQRYAFKAKLLSDLTGKPLWPCAHVENHFETYSVEAVNEFLSEAVRMGATGFQLWNFDQKGNKAGTNHTRFDYYGHRQRWDQIMDVVDRLRTIGKLKRPDPEFAILYSNDHCQTLGNCNVVQNEAAFNLLGPNPRTWFSYISDIQILDEKVKLADWNTVIIPKASIQRREISEMFLDYPRDGRTLVSLDGEVFNNHADGSSTADVREKLFGVTVGGYSSVRTVVFRKSDLWPDLEAGATLALVQAPRKVTVSGPATVLAEFEDGTPAIVMKKHPGQGRAIYFAFNLSPLYPEREPWRDFYRTFAKGLGLSTGQDIWRFRFPLTKSERPVPESEPWDCLTGNHLVWWMNEAIEMKNRVPEGASYSYSVAPDGPGEQFLFEKAILVDRGDLTDRLTAPKAGNLTSPINAPMIKAGKLKLDHFYVGWSTPDPISITFDFAQDVTVSRVRAVYSGSLPALHVEVSADGKTFRKAGSARGVPPTEDIHDIMVDLTPAKGRKVRLTVPRRRAGDKLHLSEIEVWGR